MNPILQQRVSRWIDEQVASGKLPRGEILIQHRGRLVCAYSNKGLAVNTKESSEGAPTIYRLYSMTKPIVSLAVMLLFEEGKFQLSDPIWKFLGEKWKKQNMKVMDVKAMAANKSMDTLVTVPCKKSITIHHLLTHTSGLSHGLNVPGMNDPLDAHYTKVGLATTNTLLRRTTETRFESLQHFCDQLAECPLLFHPGEHWHYSYAVDLLGRIVEVVSGQTLEDFLQERIFKKLGMKDTSFDVPKEKLARLSGLWLPRKPGGKSKDIGETAYMPSFQSGSGGLYGTCQDYLLFTEMLLRGGLTRQGERVVSKKTLEWMTMNHLRSPQDRSSKTMRQMGFGHLANDQPHGIGFGLGFAVAVDVPYDSLLVTKKSYFWGGAASTLFWVDPDEDLTVVFCTALLLPDPVDNPINPSLRAIIYGGLEHEDARPTSACHNSRL